MLVGMTGYAQHGKSSAAEVLVREYGFKTMAFADPLRELAETVNPYVFPEAQLPNRYASVVKTFGYEQAKQMGDVRRFLQELGTGARDILGPDVWVRAWEHKLARYEQTDNVVVTDVRFPNEADAIRANGGEVWGLVRPGFDNGLGVDHPSEAFIGQLLEDAEVYIMAADFALLVRGVVLEMEGRMERR